MGPCKRFVGTLAVLILAGGAILAGSNCGPLRTCSPGECNHETLNLTDQAPDAVVQLALAQQVIRLDRTGAKQPAIHIQ